MTNKLLLCGILLSNMLSAIVLALTIFHHFSVKSELAEVKKHSPVEREV
ncbi:hypothetical protein [Lacicoccus alkaliphilus]|uniref:Uncharacterized protein n=1 Tax=Lacicoccus alkaliphilus DSM 16010 TaxID=1123231 RepID=A0A1M7EFT7_9BACL|nr:hypothetical protein [Salinicoccus alkaliphilus]SHL90651.1 hypothetical protein SAMN02745189_01211 [Salinicoccus alkaliphilus DSM 16010]